VSGTAQHDPTERELGDYVRYRLERIGQRFAEPEFVTEAIVFQRDLWIQLYKIDRELAAGYFSDPA
jgi:hypothetical protein